MRGKIVTITLLCFLFVSIPGFSQTSTNAQLTGVVTDQSGALIPGVTITARKADTGVVTTTLTNEAGVYTFQGLQPGRGYSVSAALPGFQTINYTDLELSAATVFRRNFQLQVAAATTTLEVSVSLEGVLLESSPSVGDVLTETRVRNLPIVGNNVLDLLEILPGVRFNGTGAWMGDYANTVGGQSLDSLNVTLDGLPMRDERFSASSGTFQSQNLSGGTGGGQSTAFIAPGGYTGGNSLLSTTTIHPDLVGEVRLILAPVDAEFGRGNSQIQITTRSGTNQYAGSAVWNIQNTSLNPNTWNRNNDRGNAFTGCKIKGETPPCWQPTQPDWRNTHQNSLSFGGPIVKNKTFFFVLYDQQISKFRALQTNTVLTDTARKGIFRFWEGWVPGDADIGTTAITTSNANPTRPAVDFEGRPLAPAAWPNGVPYTGRLGCFSVFGTVKADGSPFSAADCAPSGLTDVSGRPYSVVAYMPPGGALLWDPKRPAAAAAALGYFNKILKEMPTANNFEAGQTDGLNTAAFRWLLNRTGGNEIAGGLGGGNAGQNALVGSAAYQNRKQINIKIDQNFGSHRIAGSWTHQVDESEVPFAGWPNGLSGLTGRGPHTLSVNVTSTLRPTLINEGRFGLNINKASTTNPWNFSDSTIRDRARSFFLKGGASLSGNASVYPILVSPSSGGLNFGGGLMPTGADSFFRNPLYDVAETISWLRGKHAFKFGADFRFPRSEGAFGLQPIPLVSYGNRGGTNTESPFATSGASSSLGTTGTPDAANTTNLFPQNARNTARDLAYLLTNSLGGVNTPYWAENYEQVSAGIRGWQDVTTQKDRIRRMVFNDYAIFAKDDWKVRPSLTLNLGVRYEYYAPPYITSGLTSTVVDQGNGLFGVGRGAGGKLFNDWLSPGNLYLTGYGTNGTGPGTNGLGSAGISLTCSSTAAGSFASRLPAPNCDPNLESKIEFVGPNSPNPNKTIIPRDRNNFGPAIGFAWQVPWFGQGKTTVRGGYQVIFQRVNIGESTLASALGGFLDQSANENDPAVQAIAGATGLNRALLLSDLPSLVPVPPSRAPGRTVPVYGRSESVIAFDPNFATPYTQNLTLSVSRSLSRQLTLDVRYVGSLSRKLPGNLDLNASTVYYNQELFDALSAARRGENPALLDQMLAGLDLAPGTGDTNWTIGGVSGTYPTDRLYGPIGTCMTLVNVPGYQTPPIPGDPRCPAGQVFNSGAEHVRRATTFGPAGGFGAPNQIANRLANGTFGLVTDVLAGGFVPTGGLQPLNLPVGGTIPSQRLLRNGCDRIGNGMYDPSAPAVYPTVDPRATTFGVVGTGNIPTRCFPENYLIANPQLNNATYNANLGRNNYHSLLVQLNMRPVQGISFQSSYTWAKSMGLPTSGYNDPLNREFDRQKGTERAHDLRLNGIVELPFGPNKLLFANTSGWLARLTERWQVGFIFNAASGAPQSITGARATRYGFSQNFQPYGNARLVPTEHWKIPKGKVEFSGGVSGNAFAAFGNQLSDLGTYFGVDTPGNIGSYTTLIDPQCYDSAQVAQTDSKGFSFARDAAGCTLRALAQRVPAGTPGSFQNPNTTTPDPLVFVLVNPKPGEYGVLTPNSLTRFGFWSFDANLQKSFRISESKQLTIRVDATNVLNHPEPFIPLYTTNDVFISQFGVIECGCGDSKSGTRTFQAQVRLTF